MALTLDASVGTSTANSFCDLVTAQAIIDETPNSGAWGDDADLQAQALVYATRMLGALAYRGVKTTVGQSLSWPRGGVIDPDYGDASAAISGYMVNGSQWGVYLDQHAIPTRIQRGTVMLALEILRAGASDVWGVDPSLNVARESVDVLSTEYVPIPFRRVGLRQYPSVWREVYPLTLASQPGSVERA